MSTALASRTMILLAVVLVVGGCGSSRANRSTAISVHGLVGPLSIDRSDRGQVIAYAGKPEADLHGRGDSSRYEVLGYGCPHHLPPLRDYVIDCRTAFYLVRGKLGLFFTQERSKWETGGVRIGMPTARAERLLHRKVYEGCGAYVWFYGKRRRLTVEFGGGSTRKVRQGRLLLVGGHVAAFYLHSKDRDPGVTDCA